MQKDESQENWLCAAQEMHDLLCSYGFEHVSVDIIDWRLEEGPSIFVCEPTDIIFSKWDMVRRRILDSVDTSGFQMLGCHRMCYESRAVDCKPTVLVTVNPKFERDWDIAKQDISNILTDFDLPGVVVQIYKDRGIFCVGQRSIEIATIGHSVSARDSSSYGTFGGWLNIRQSPDSEWEPFAGMMKHVKDGDSALHNRLHPSESAEEADCPSYGEIKRHIDVFKQTVSELQREEPYRTLEKLRADGDLPDELKEKWQKHRAHINSHEGSLANLEAYSESKMHRYNMLVTTFFTVAENGKQHATDEHSVLRGLEKAFFEPGDSGALIFKKTGAMVGMGFGGQVQGQVSVFTHVNDLIDDIKDQTGVDQVTIYTQEWPIKGSEGDQD
ncbi:hypothetical protein BDV25DRAFT_136487 [Aspergillus avenaceus]|uniref:Uncharacterized protein n=1 Tax=Aspergillus avenaceus TaxID=36643 RepID=A0A5N6U5U7_ASPAV|nr:hypothetical protein BDV25DRAFT_136487 [Aspergillus avenaceus]